MANGNNQQGRCQNSVKTEAIKQRSMNHTEGNTPHVSWIKRTMMLVMWMLMYTYTQAAYTPQSVPNPKLTHGYVANPDNLLSQTMVETLNQQLKRLERETEVQIAVVALNSIGNYDYTEFAYDLATTWGVGNEKRNTGLLILLVLDQRAVRIEVGNGLEGLLPDAVCNEILQQDIFPEFQEGNYDKGFSNGINTIIARLTQDEAKAELLLDREYAPRRVWVDVIIYYLMLGFLLLIICAWWGWRKMNELPNASNNIRYAHIHDYVHTCWLLSIAFPVPLLLWTLYAKRLHKKIRLTPITCPECRHKMTLLTESEEDVHLNKKQQHEEDLQSVNYDVWECKHCYNHIILPYIKTKTPYTECQNCHAIACKLQSDLVKVQPSQHYCGIGERIYICSHCGKQIVNTYTIPKLPVVVVTGGSATSGFGGGFGGGGFSGGGAGGHF